MMDRKQIPIYATSSDLTLLVQEVSSQRPLSFIKAGLFSEDTVAVLHIFEYHESLRTYLAFDQNKNVNIRRVSQRTVPEKYAIDQKDNPHTVCIKCGGLISETHLIAGQIGIIGAEHDSDQIYSVFVKVLRSKFKKIKSYYVGPEAALLLNSGIRLSPTEKSSRIYDLVP